jgi:haloacetate dehalogenase
MDRRYDVPAIWRERAKNVTGRGMPGGHNMQEGAPTEVLAELGTFLRAGSVALVATRSAALVCA